ncbi:MAG: hypothetical protein QXT31_00015 [Candidatus Bathyarchaeia archaeon]
METVLKIGGSLSKKPDKLMKLCIMLGDLAKKHCLTVVPGGAEFADTVRHAYKLFSLSENVAHKMAILAMEQYGLLLSDITPNSRIAKTIKDCIKLSKKGFLPILLPHWLLYRKNPFKPSWNITSDSISVYIAYLLKAKNLILIKDVDGVYDKNGEVLSITTLNWLKKNKTCLDKYFPFIMKKAKLKCYIVNGLYPKRLKMLLEGGKTLCTEILT